MRQEPPWGFSWSPLHQGELGSEHVTSALSLKGSEKDTRYEALRLGAEAKATAGQGVNLRAEAVGIFFSKDGLEEAKWL